jgi:hypothetical protein
MCVPYLPVGSTKTTRFMLDKMVGRFEDAEGVPIADAEAAMTTLRAALSSTRVDSVRAMQREGPLRTGWTPPPKKGVDAEGRSQDARGAGRGMRRKKRRRKKTK